MSQLMSTTGAIPEWTLGDRIYKARRSVGLDQLGLAAVTGLSRTSIGNYEAGKTRPSKASIKLIALATGVDRYWLLTGMADGPDGGAEQGKSSIIWNAAYGRRQSE